MEKNNVILVFTNPNLLNTALGYVNLETVNIVAILTDGGDGKVLTINQSQQVPIYSFAMIRQITEQGKNFCWLICGGWGDTYSVKKFLEKSGVPKENIFNFSIYNHITPSWIANIRYIEKNPVDLNFSCEWR